MIKSLEVIQRLSNFQSVPLFHNSSVYRQLPENIRRFASSMTTDKYKLTYFNIRGRAEPIRFIFALADIPYEDVRVERPNWPAVKEKFPWGQVPILEINGKVLAQSNAISRHLARKYNLTGKDEIEAAKCDEYVDALSDLRANWRTFFFEADEEKKTNLKKELLEVLFPRNFGKFTAILDASGGDFLLGENVTWADLVFAHTLEFFEDTVQPDVLKDYPALQKFKDAVYNIPNIKNWLTNRPKTNM